MYNINRFVLQELGKLWRVTECEEIVGQIQIIVNWRLFTNCFAESSVIRSVSGVKSICIAPNCQSE